MEEQPKQKLPFYAQASLLFIAMYAFVYLLYIGQEIIVPALFSIMIAVLLNPLVNFLQKRKVPRITAISITLVFACLVVTLLVYFICSQLFMFSEKLPVLEKRFSDLLQESVRWVSHTFHIPQWKINQWLTKSRTEVLMNSSSLIGTTLNTITGIMTLAILIPIYVFMMIYYEPLFIEFIKRVFNKSNHAKIGEMITESKIAMQHYLSGLLLEAVIVAVMNAAGLLILGIQYALLWAIIGAILNVIPYIGGIIAVSFPMLMALVTKDSFSYVFLVMLVYIIVQMIDNNYIMPKVVASKVKINALVSVVVVLIGGGLWGISGMFLSIPLTAVVKIICDRVQVLKPYGYLLGDTMPESDRHFFTFRRRKKIAATPEK